MFPQLFGKYVLERELASGGMAIVYLATLRGAGGFEKRLVVKQIRAELASDRAFVERFVAEAKTTVGLSHPNIVPVYELGVEQGVYFIAMELALGVTLSELIAASGPLSPAEGAYIGVEICRALDYAHRKAGVVHRDVTPRNVLVDEEGHVRLIDFGIAAPVSVEGAARERVFGSPGHMPPEQIRGGRLSPATDVFAVAALLVEGWTGRAPFRRATREESDRALALAPPRLSDATPGLGPLDELFARALSIDPAKRPPTAEELARPLRDFLKTADLGDLARRLGQRVRKARRSPSIADLLPSPFTPAGATPATPAMSLPGALTPHTATGTRPRSVPPAGAESATRPLSVPPAGAESATRPLSVPPAAAEPGTRPRSVPPAPLTPAERGASGPVTETFATRDEVVEWTRGSSFPPPARQAEPPPGRTPAFTPRPAPTQPPSLGKPVIWLLALGALAAAALFGLPSTPPAGGGRSAASAPLGAPKPPAAARSPGALREPSTEPQARASAGPETSAPGRAPALEPLHRNAASSPAPSARPALAGSSEAITGFSTLAVTSDLPALVRVDGIPVGSTPLRVKKPPGPHAITLTSTSLGESLTTNLVAHDGQTVAVHAEFTRPVPTLRVR